MHDMRKGYAKWTTKLHKNVYIKDKISFFFKKQTKIHFQNFRPDPTCKLTQPMDISEQLTIGDWHPEMPWICLWLYGWVAATDITPDISRCNSSSR